VGIGQFISCHTPVHLALKTGPSHATFRVRLPGGYTAYMGSYMALALVPLSTGHTHIVRRVGELLAPYRLVNDIAGRPPEGFIDYWLIGGLYDGALTNHTSRVEYVDQAGSSVGSGHLVGFRVPTEAYDPHVWLGNNQLAVAALPPVDEWKAHIGLSALLTADGQWYSRDNFVDDDGWQVLVQDILDRHLDCWAITLQYHC